MVVFLLSIKKLIYDKLRDIVYRCIENTYSDGENGKDFRRDGKDFCCR